jgi:hypothetical protein
MMMMGERAAGHEQGRKRRSLPGRPVDCLISLGMQQNPISASLSCSTHHTQRHLTAIAYRYPVPDREGTDPWACKNLLPTDGHEASWIWWNAPICD